MFHFSTFTKLLLVQCFNFGCIQHARVLLLFMMYFFYSVLWKLLFWRFHITDYQNNLFLTTNSNTNLVLECRTGLCGRETVLRLTHNSCSFNWKMKMQLSKQGLDPQNFSFWPAVLAKLLHFASVLDLATGGRLLLGRPGNQLDTREIKYPDVDLVIWVKGIIHITKGKQKDWLVQWCWLKKTTMVYRLQTIQLSKNSLKF